jgi:hypothetical protein
MISNNFDIFKKILISTIILFFFLNTDWVYSSTHEDRFNPNDSLKRVAAIKIIPYNPLANIKEKEPTDDHRVLLPDEVRKALQLQTETVDSSKVEADGYISEYHREPIAGGASFDPNRMRFGTQVKPDQYASREGKLFPAIPTTYQEPFGFGRNCVYAPEELDQFEWIPDGSAAGSTSEEEFKVVDVSPANVHGSYAAGSHGYYLQKLAQYQRDLNVKENLLLVHMQLKIEDEPHDYIFGIFISGTHDNLKLNTNSCTAEDLLLSLKPKGYETRSAFDKDDKFVKFWDRQTLLNKRDVIKKAAVKAASEIQTALIEQKKVHRAGDRIYFDHSTFPFTEEIRLGLLGQEETDMDKLLLERLWKAPEFKLSKTMSFTGYEGVRTLKINFLKRLFGDTLISALLAKQIKV